MIGKAGDKAEALPPFVNQRLHWGSRPRQRTMWGFQLKFIMGTAEALPPSLSVNCTVTGGNSPGVLKPSSFCKMGWDKLSHSHGC